VPVTPLPGSAADGRRFREARERAGLSLDDVSNKTRIPVKWLAALEAGDTASFPKGPFLGGYTRQYCSFLGVSEETGEPSPEAGGAPMASQDAGEAPMESPVIERAPAPWQAPPAGPAPAAHPAPVSHTRGAASAGRPTPRSGDDGIREVRRGLPNGGLPTAGRQSRAGADEGDRTHTDTTTTSPAHWRRRNRRMLGLGVLAAVGVLALALLTRGGDAESTLGVAPDQVLLVTSASGQRARVFADGREVPVGSSTPGGSTGNRSTGGPSTGGSSAGGANAGEGLAADRLPAGKQVRFAAHDRLSIELDSLEGVTLVYNGRTLKPLGAQSRARRLVFIDREPDAAPAATSSHGG
jgi:transcriptional regulator with XRE-family HTH domain